MFELLETCRYKISLIFWGSIRKVTYRVRPSALYYYLKFKHLIERNKKREAYKLLLDGADYYHKDHKLNLYAARYYLELKNWPQSIKYFKRLFLYHDSHEPQSYIDYSHVYLKIGKINESKRILLDGLEVYPEFRNIYYQVFNLATSQRDWDLTVRIYELMEKYQIKLSKDIMVKRAMIAQSMGEFDVADEIYKLVFDNSNHSSKYSKIVLFDNGESRIEFYKRHSDMNLLCLTFDSINITWEQQPFGFRMLSKENVDIIALRRRREDSYHQDLSNEEYYNNVNKLTQHYQRLIAYGFSIGGYTALYYGAKLNAEILSISPRNSTHPIFGVNQEGKEDFRHQIRHEINEKIKPIIAYDPKNNIDCVYVEEELKRSFPNGIYSEYPYVGHRVLPYFHQVGILKETIQSVLDNNDFPIISKKDKKRSHQYLRVLGSECLRRNKPNWALSLGEMALQVASNDAPSYRLVIKSLLTLEREEDIFKKIDQASDNGVDDVIINEVRLFLELKTKYNNDNRFLKLIEDKLMRL